MNQSNVSFDPLLNEKEALNKGVQTEILDDDCIHVVL